MLSLGSFHYANRLARAGRFCVVLSFLWPGIATTAAAQACHFFGQPNADLTSRQLERAPSCRAANDYLLRCRWGSSADVGFAAIVEKKCEASFLTRFPADATARYKQERTLCGAYINSESGTLDFSEAAVCAAGVAVDFATNPNSATRRPLRASFDCARAQSPIELSTCTNQALGDADIAMERAYRAAVKSVKLESRPLFVQQQKLWQTSVVAECKIQQVPAPSAAVSCAVASYTKRAIDLKE